MYLARWERATFWWRRKRGRPSVLDKKACTGGDFAAFVKRLEAERSGFAEARKRARRTVDLEAMFVPRRVAAETEARLADPDHPRIQLAPDYVLPLITKPVDEPVDR